MRHLTIGLAIAFMFVAGRGVDVSAVEASECKGVQGHLEETLVTGAACTSPVGLCTVAQMFGAVQGEAQFTASAIIPSVDTPTTGVVFVIGDTVIEDAKVAGRRGTLTVKNAAAFRTVDDGDLVDVQTITGGTGELVGTTGSLRISGNFIAATGGRSTYEGVVCLP
jgi:hypothetical protein